MESINTSTNRITNTGFTYDAAGNLTNDGSATYTWNAKGRMAAYNGGAVTYTYDGDGKRVKKAAGSPSQYDRLYWYGPGGQVLAESELDGDIISEFIYFGGTRIARRDASTGNVYYFLSDRLGNARIMTNAFGTVVEESDFYPFGIERPIINTLDNNYKFTGHERDAASGLDHTAFRQYSCNTGRWLSPDVVRGRVNDPQSWNRYAYVENSPTNAIDPNGDSHCTFYAGANEGATEVECDPYYHPFGGLVPRQYRPAGENRRIRFGKAIHDLSISTFKKDCNKIFAALETSADAVREGAVNANVHYGTDFDTSYGSLYENAANEFVRRAGMADPRTIGEVLAATGTLAVSELGGNDIYVDIYDSNFYTGEKDLKSMAFHEVLHNITGLNDPEIEERFIKAGLIKAKV